MLFIQCILWTLYIRNICLFISLKSNHVLCLVSLFTRNDKICGLMLHKGIVHQKTKCFFFFHRTQKEPFKMMSKLLFSTLWKWMVTTAYSFKSYDLHVFLFLTQSYYFRRLVEILWMIYLDYFNGVFMVLFRVWQPLVTIHFHFMEEISMNILRYSIVF